LYEDGGQITFTSQPPEARGVDGTVRATDVATGKTYDAAVQRGGRYELRLPPGSYWLTGQYGMYPEFQCFRNGMQPVSVRASETVPVNVLCPIE
jgi:hypothetical protein